MKPRYLTQLKKLEPCGAAMLWIDQHQFETLQQAWDACERGDWMLWLLGKLSGRPGSASRKRLVKSACACARLSLPIFEKRYPDDKRPRSAIETAEAHVNGKANLAEVRSAASAAYTAAYAASAAYTAAYAASAAYTAASAASAAYAASASASAAYTAAYAASAASAARSKVLKECAVIVRSAYPKAPRL